MHNMKHTNSLLRDIMNIDMGVSGKCLILIGHRGNVYGGLRLKLSLIYLYSEMHTALAHIYSGAGLIQRTSKCCDQTGH
jgi:hypothetical protein